jgi:hypothetical protein
MNEVKLAYSDTMLVMYQVDIGDSSFHDIWGHVPPHPSGFSAFHDNADQLIAAVSEYRQQVVVEQELYNNNTSIKIMMRPMDADDDRVFYYIVTPTAIVQVIELPE